MSDKYTWTLSQLYQTLSDISYKKESLLYLTKLQDNLSELNYSTYQNQELEAEILNLSKLKAKTLSMRNQNNNDEFFSSLGDEILSKGSLFVKASGYSQLIYICSESEKFFDYMLEEYSRRGLSKLCRELHSEFLEFKIHLIEEFRAVLENHNLAVLERIRWMDKLKASTSNSSTLCSFLKDLLGPESLDLNILDNPLSEQYFTSTTLDLIKNINMDTENFNSLNHQFRQLLKSSLSLQGCITSWVAENHSPFPNEYPGCLQSKADQIHKVKSQIALIRQEVTTLSSLF